ncbi:mediator of RNA polymerase II transcription subunit 12 [Condylostylus longicornis]|uniref:mediator of RNA polymerase II transcription subunit 12 n=1 Tax=Condylostylus longicornis TaxID=2530218 RepID=UPI00244E02FF|nr:mediator of RNA polymerase II transcription subunit 12 [Condylostylus longicornis]XP_055373235.1 mediator of RNA polymerase II transcription subunit 12 [Condylostylus longicornis]
MLTLLQEKRPLKRPRLGPPDIYPQEAKQKEDELTSLNVKHGFATMPQLSDEFGTAHNSNVTANKVAAFFNLILSKKEELMTLPDTGRKKQQINVKDNFWPVSPRTKTTLDQWFKDLAGNKPLLSLAKKAPSFNKKEDIFSMLCENQVSMQRATWFIKLSSAYTVAVSEAKIKKRQIPDPTTEWTGTLVKYMKDLLPKLQESYNPEKPASNVSHNTNPLYGHVPMLTQSITSPAPIHGSGSMALNNLISSGDENKNVVKHWNYCTQLSKFMYEEGLLDRQEFLNWLLELLEKMKFQLNDDGFYKLILPFCLQYLPDFVQSERLSRKLAHVVGKKISNLLNNAVENYNLINMQNEMSPGPDPLERALHEYMNCPHHKEILLYLSSIIQVVTIECPTALVWCGLGESRALSPLAGSPLDQLPIPPSALPMPSRYALTNDNIRMLLRDIEEKIKTRSKQAENKWCAEQWQKDSVNCFSKVLKILDALDGHCFDRMDTQNSIETLYPKIFEPFTTIRQEVGNNGETKDVKVEYTPESDAPTVKILCEWAVSCQRWGEHRAMAVAYLLDKRQTEVTSPIYNEYMANSNGNDDKDSVGSGLGLIGGVPVFQQVLMNFLDHDAPVLEENGNQQNRAQFINLVHLFSELIRHDVFSHNAYLCTLISRGDLLTGSANAVKPTSITGTGPVSNKASPPNNNTFDDDGFPTGMDFKQNIEEFDDSNVDDDLDKLLQHIKEKDQQGAMEAPDSPKDPDHVGTGTTSANNESHISRHFIYTKHFPIYQDDPSSPYSSESNQRYVLLFGVGKERDEKKHAVKKMSKEICKLFSKKFSIDVAEGGKVKKHSRNEFNFEATTNKCQNMAYFDQHIVTSQCAVTVLEMLNSFAAGNGNYLPVQEHVAFLFDLMEMALNIYGLIDICNQILKELPEVENQLMIKKSNLIKSYTTSLGLYIVGILRRYHNCLLLSPEQTISVFEGLCRTVKHVYNPCDCSSAERCILAYLGDLYSSCCILKTKPQYAEHFYLIYPKIRQALVLGYQISASPRSYNPHFFMDILSSPRRFGKIDSLWGRQINESPSNIFSFVCNAVIVICRERDNEKLNDIAISCAEFTACCNALSAEWLSVLEALCGSSNETKYRDLVGQIDIQNHNVHNSLAVFTCILVARHGFSLENFVMKVALPALGNTCNNGRELSPDTEASARISCHLLLMLFKTIEIPQPGLYSVSTSPNPINANSSTCNIKLSCDRHLLVAAHKNIQVEAVLTVLKAILVVADSTAPPKPPPSMFTGGKRSGFNTPVHPGSTPKNIDRPADLSHILGTSEHNVLNENDDMMFDLHHPNHHNANVHEQHASLSDFAQHVLKQICSQEWVLERCLQASDKLCSLLIEDIMTPKQVQRLFQMICYPENEYTIIADMDQKSVIIRILENLEQWTLRISWLQLQLMYKQSEHSHSESAHWLDTVARASIDVFQTEEIEKQKKGQSSKQTKSKSSTYLVEPLIAKLPNAVQGRILRVAGHVLETTNFFSKYNHKESYKDGYKDGYRENYNHNYRDNYRDNYKDNYKDNTNYEEKEKPTTKKKTMDNQPFLSLILACLKGQDEQKECLLTSLHNQLSQFVQCVHEFENIGGIDSTAMDEMLEALQLRFSLLGGMFESIQKNGSSTIDWTILLAQLVCYGVIDLCTNSELFTTVLDMMATLVHSTLVTENETGRDDNKKLYNNLMKKLKKEIGEKNNGSIKYIRQLLPLTKLNHEVISCEPAGGDSRGCRFNFFDLDKKQLRIADKQRVSVWDVLEGHKNPAPLSWAWFGAVKLERKPLAYEENHRLLRYHTHSLVKPSSYYYEPLPLPPEDVDQVPEKILKDDMKADTPSSVDQSPSAPATGRGRGKGTRKPRKPKAPKTPPVNQQHLQIQQQSQQLPQEGQSQIQQTMQNQMNQMQMNMQNQMNPNMQQYQPNQIMQQGPNQMINQQMAQGNMQQTMIGNQPQNNTMGFVSGPSVPGMMQNNQQTQQAQQWANNYNPMQAQQTQQFYNPQGMQNMQRMSMNPSSKQALSNMLRQKNTFMGGQQQTNPGALSMQQQQRQQQLQMQQQQQQQMMMRNNMRGMAPNQMGGQQNSIPNQMNQMNNLAQIPQQQNNINQVLNSNSMMAQQSQMQQQNVGMSGGQNAPQMMNTNAGMMTNANTGSSGNPNIMSQQNTGMVQGAGMAGQATAMQSQNTGLANQGGAMTGQANNMMNQQNVNPVAMVNQQAAQQFQQFGTYNNQNMNQQSGPQMMNPGFSQMAAPQRNTQAEYIAQQRAMQQANRGQYMNQAPNVTMNNMMGGGQGAAPPYRQQAGVGHAQQQQQQQFQQQQRLRQQMLMQQQQQQQGGMNMGQGGAPGMVSQQNPTVGQQTPNLVAQLQRPQNMMGQQYPHQPPPY